MSNYSVFSDDLITGCIITDKGYKVQIVEYNDEVAKIISGDGNYEADGFSNERVESMFARSQGACN